MKYLYFFIILILTLGCNPIKYYTLTKINNSHPDTFTAVDLDSYDFYKLEKYYKNSGTIITKDDVDKKSDSLKTRYELQTLLIEKNPAPGKGRKVIIFSCYPPYKWHGRNVYDYPFYDDHSIFNIESINYIMFGQVNDNKFTFKRKGYDSVWDFQIVDRVIIVNNVQFKNNGKVVNVSTNALGNLPRYKPMLKPKILLQQDVRDPISPETTDSLKSNTIYYDNQYNELYFHFSSPLNEGDDKDWIYFKSDRILAPLL